ncbi:MAG TPA: 16S rRNA (cytosine(967)-C(5))-methyltransferase RsmB [Rhodanobacteraceae bacterium]|jgi:16S rRNA (cytosine967-C5)-methyltransferase|nr:16S rRNA (cytosine(967)-C(5))-methyltransferase RsmB [Rhodanobacteraceae bacterium]
MTAAAIDAANVRAIAARALQRIAGGHSLRAEFAASSTKLHDSRDRALLSALLHAGARWWLRYDAALDRLLERPLRKREPQLHALLVLGLVQLDVLRLPEYAAVAATVDAVRAIGKAQFSGMANAVLRRWLRERETFAAALDAGAQTRTAHPAWLLAAIAADWPDAVDAIIAANNAEGPLWLRVNRRRVARAALLEQFIAAGIYAQAPEALPDALVLAQSRDVTALPGYEAGLFSVQDGAAQFAADLLDLRDGQRVLDACAAPGGKSAQILERADVALLALDRDAQRLPRLRANLDRLGLRAEVRAGDALLPKDWWNAQAFDRILLDAPCSATGIIRRQPDIKLHRRADDIAKLARTQTRLLEAMWLMLAPGGRLVYATCSILDAENAAQVEGFLARHADARSLPVAVPGWRATRAGGAQNLPGESGMDGFFYAVLEKHR